MDQIYNANETALCLRILKGKTLSMKSDIQKHGGFKQSKDQVTLLLCTNKRGSHKLKPLHLEVHEIALSSTCQYDVNAGNLVHLAKN